MSFDILRGGFGEFFKIFLDFVDFLKMFNGELQEFVKNIMSGT